MVTMIDLQVSFDANDAETDWVEKLQSIVRHVEGTEILGMKMIWCGDTVQRIGEHTSIAVSFVSFDADADPA